jgi:type IV pilus assembly protein PilB
MGILKKLFEKKIIDKAQLTSLEFEVKTSGKKEEEVILEKQILSEDELYKLKSEDLKIPLREVFPEEVPLRILEKIPEETAKHYKMIGIGEKGNVLEVGMVYPEDLSAREALAFLSRQQKFNLKIFLIKPTTFENLLRQIRTFRKEVSVALSELEKEIAVEKLEERPKTAEEIAKLAEEAPISKVVAVMLRHAVDGKASDIHIEPGKEKMRVRFRSLGELHSSLLLPMRIHPAIVARIKILSNLKLDESRIPQDGRFSAKIEDRDIDFRVSTFPTTLGEKVAIRVLDPRVGLKKFEELGLTGRNYEVIKREIQRPWGMILATGPTGSGKTTTLYAILQILNREGVNIVTLEDPVEYFIEGINQSQIRPELNYDFATGLRSILRQDPDIIMVGEIRDEESAGLAIHAALTGHIVLSTLHTTNAIGVIPRLIDMGIKPYLIPPTLRIALAQRLVRRLCDNCKRKVKAKKEISDLILKEIEEMPEEAKKEAQEKIKKPIYVYEPVGCPKCNKTGFSGRIAVFEVLAMTDTLADIILKEPTELKLREEAKRQGMITMMQDGILKVLDGITTIEEVIRVAEEK